MELLALSIQVVSIILLVALLLKSPAKSAGADPAVLLKMDALESAIGRLEPTLREEFRISRENLEKSLHDSRREASESASSVRLELIDIIGRLTRELNDGIRDFRREDGENAVSLQTVLTGQFEAMQRTATEQQLAFREAGAQDFKALKFELIQSISGVRSDQVNQNDVLKQWIQNNVSRMSSEIGETSKQLTDTVKSSLDDVKKEVKSLSDRNEQRQETLRLTVEGRLDKLSDLNAAKLEEMRQTVDEKLHATLEKRLTASFGLVTDQLGKVQTGLGEMKEIATNVGDLKRVLTNVKVRGGFAEVQLGLQLEQMLSPNQYSKNVRVRPDTQESVEFAIRLPQNDGDDDLLLPIDAKFPREDWERLEEAHGKGDAEAVMQSSKALESSVRMAAKTISEKYIHPPYTTNFAVMFLPTEGLFAEVVKRPGLVDDLQTKYRVCVAGPTTFMALLTSLQMGFKTLAIQKKGSEVWNLLAATKLEFQKFGGLMEKVEKQVGTVQKTLSEVGTRTRTINRKLKSVDVLEMEPSIAAALVGADDDDEIEEVDEGDNLKPAADSVTAGS